MQLMSDLTHQPIDRAKQRGDMTSLGTAFLAGLATGKILNYTRDKQRGDMTSLGTAYLTGLATGKNNWANGIIKYYNK